MVESPSAESARQPPRPVFEFTKLTPYILHTPRKLNNCAITVRSSRSMTTGTPTSGFYASPSLAAKKHRIQLSSSGSLRIRTTRRGPPASHTYRPSKFPPVSPNREDEQARTVLESLDEAFAQLRTRTMLTAPPIPELSELPPLPERFDGFILAAVLGKMEHMQQYISTLSGTVMDRKRLVNTEDRHGRTALFYAVFTGT